MSKKEFNNFIYEDNYLRYESYLKGFLKEKFDEFDAIAEKVGLDSKIKDLMDSQIVNDTENQAALHHEYRKMYELDSDGALPDNFMSSFKNYDFGNLPDGVDFYDNIYEELSKEDDDVNIISIGIGGSFEGPRLMLESNTYTNRYHKRFEGLNFYFLTGPDPDEFKTKVSHLDPSKTFLGILIFL